MTLDGGGLVEAGVRAGKNAQWMSASNLVVKDFTGPGIRFEKVGRRVSIMNNTVVNCGGGIRVDAVSATSESRVEPNTRIWEPSFVENNLIYNCTQYGIKIGNGSNSAAVWSPFTWALPGNSIVPVGYNMVVVENANPPGFSPWAGDEWYTLDYPSAERYGEVFLNGLLQGSSVFLGQDDYRLAPQAPSQSQAAGAGSPLRIDVLPGTETADHPLIMRRSVGAIPAHDPAYYSAWGGEP